MTCPDCLNCPYCKVPMDRADLDADGTTYYTCPVTDCGKILAMDTEEWIWA